uniref:Uncharacterized protein n=1 Tax=Anguilla anguilla TaxID=7936 RepID=A0A0E9UUL4_ANGAN
MNFECISLFSPGLRLLPHLSKFTLDYD